jgi:DNA-binding MarR family transcriptional regulator
MFQFKSSKPQQKFLQNLQASPVGSTQTLLFHQAVADKLGVNATDHKCIIFLLNGPQTPSKLAHAIGLTSGALTAVVDRLEKNSFVTRKHDATDRRRTLVYLQPKIWQRLEHIFSSLVQATHDLEAQYSAADLKIIYEYMQKTGELLVQQTRLLQK